MTSTVTSETINITLNTPSVIPSHPSSPVSNITISLNSSPTSSVSTTPTGTITPTQVRQISKFILDA